MHKSMRTLLESINPIMNEMEVTNVIVDGNVTLDNIQRTSDSEEFTAVANGFGSSVGSEDYDIDVNDIPVDIKIEAFGSVHDGEFKIVSVTGDGMNFVHEDGENWGDYTDAFVNAMQTEAVEEEKKNCGCGKDPCETYGKTDVEEAMGPMAKVNDEGQIEMTKADYAKIHRDYKTKIDDTYMALRLDHKTGGTVLTPVTFIDAVAEGEEVRSEEKDTNNMTNSMNEGKVKAAMIDDSETMSKEDFIKKYDQENADDLYEASIKKVCKDCGDEIHKPTTDCKHDCDDEMGENWVTESSTLEESPTMDTTQLVSMLHNAGLSEEAIERKINEWANSPADASETEPTSHGDPYEFAQPVNLSLKSYMGAQDLKVSVTEHTVDTMKALYEESKKKTMVKGPDGKMVPDYAVDGKGKDDLKKDKDVKESASMSDDPCSKCEGEGCDYCDDTGVNTGTELAEAQSAAQKAAFEDMLAKKEPTMDDEPEYDGDKKEPTIEESLEESKELAILLRNAGL